MKNKRNFWIIKTLFLSACGSKDVIPVTTSDVTLTEQSMARAIQTLDLAPPSPLPSTISSQSTVTPTSSAQPSVALITPLAPTIQPVVHGQQGNPYDLIFSVPVNRNSLIQYEELPGAIFGPNAIAVLPDDSVLISDHTTNRQRLLHFDLTGQLLKSIDLSNLGISYVSDMRIRGDSLFLLEMTNQGIYRIHQMSLEGDLLRNEDIPKTFPSSSGRPLASGEVSIAIDCDLNVLVEVAGGYRVYRFSDVLNGPISAQIPDGYPCNQQFYRVIDAPSPLARIQAGDANYETRLNNGYGGLSFLEVFEDGSFMSSAMTW